MFMATLQRFSIVYHQQGSGPIYIKYRTEDSTVLKTLKQEYYYNHRDVYHADFSISKHSTSPCHKPGMSRAL